MFSSSLAKKALAASASLALAVGGAVTLTSSAQAADATPVVMTFDAGDTLGAAASAFEGGASVIADSPTGHTGKVLKFTKAASGQQWSGVNLVLPDNNLQVTTGANPVITMDYFSGATAATPVMIKLQDAAGWPGGHICLKSVEAKPGWNFLSFDMSTCDAYDTNVAEPWVYEHLVREDYRADLRYIVAAIFPDFGADDRDYTGAAAVTPADQVFLIDNIKFNSATSAAPTAKITSPFKKVLRVVVSNATGRQVVINVRKGKTWTSKVIPSDGPRTINVAVPSGNHTVTVTVGHTEIKKYLKVR